MNPYGALSVVRPFETRTPFVAVVSGHLVLILNGPLFFRWWLPAHFVRNHWNMTIIADWFASLKGFCHRIHTKKTLEIQRLLLFMGFLCQRTHIVPD